jgi:cytochrome c oxidase assembly factor CtaG
MNTATNIFSEGWSWNPAVLFACVAAAAGWWLAFRSRARWGYVAAAIVIIVLTLVSPLNALAAGVLFTAHMTQHILLLLIAPALLLLGLPRDFSLAGFGRRGVALGFTWAAGVGSMWLWHAPTLCDAAATNGTVRAVQTLSLLVLGAAFWWPILAPRDSDRLAPAFGIIYLFTACLACTALGIILTFTPVEVCSAFRAPPATSTWASLREAIGFERDRQIGGLLMWVPMCLVYLSAIFLELARWFGAATPAATAIGPRLQEKQS